MRSLELSSQLVDGNAHRNADPRFLCWRESKILHQRDHYESLMVGILPVNSEEDREPNELSILIQHSVDESIGKLTCKNPIVSKANE